MAIDGLRCWGCCAGRTDIEDLEGKIVRDTADERGVERMILYVVYDGGVVSIYPSCLESFVARGEFSDIPMQLADSSF